MGREIRMVPPDWEHPRDERTGHYKPLYDRDYESACDEWVAGFKDWEIDGNPESEDYHYWDYYGDPPDEESYRPKFESEPTCYQIYETVSEGTPVSPVFATKADMRAWLLEQGHSEHAADSFIKDGFVFSMIIGNRGVAINLDAYDVYPEATPE